MSQKGNTENTDSDETGKVGVITAIEDLDGEMINMNNVDEDTREQWIEHLADELNDIGGVEDVYSYGNSRTNNQLGQFEITLQHSSSHFHHNRRNCIEIEGNLRSISQKISHTLRNSQFVSKTTITNRPKSQGNSLHDKSYYIIEFALR